MYRKLIEVHNWTPRQIAEDMTIPQLVALWFKDEAEGWQTVSIEEARAFARKKLAEKAKTEAGQ